MSGVITSIEDVDKYISDSITSIYNKSPLEYYEKIMDEFDNIYEKSINEINETKIKKI